MPFNKLPLELEPEPQSVAVARRWITDCFEALGREDLLECAQLATSELVTNAILHAADPIAIRLRGTRDHPRVEVSDGSTQPPLLPGPPGGDLDDLLSTFGRGLDLVARSSVTWGATIERDGKIVWFEPAHQPHEDLPPEGSILDDDPVELERPRGKRLTVHLQNMPVATLLGLRRRNTDLRRELRLLSFAHSDTYPLATQISDLFTRYDAHWPTTLIDQVNAAADNGLAVVDSDIELTVSAFPIIAQMRDLLDLADEFCRAQRLLTLARSPHQREFQDWLLGEIARQGDGEDPHPWRGSGLSRTSSEHVS